MGMLAITGSKRNSLWRVPGLRRYFLMEKLGEEEQIRFEASGAFSLCCMHFYELAS